MCVLLGKRNVQLNQPTKDGETQHVSSWVKIDLTSGPSAATSIPLPISKDTSIPCARWGMRRRCRHDTWTRCDLQLISAFQILASGDSSQVNSVTMMIPIATTYWILTCQALPYSTLCISSSPNKPAIPWEAKSLSLLLSPFVFSFGLPLSLPHNNG